MNVEEAVENLKKYISFSEKECNFPSIWDWNWHMELANDVETLLTAYEKEKEKNKELTDEYLVQRDLINPDFLKDYIHKDKIKAKIEELENQKRQWIEDRDNKHKDSEIIYAIEVLQSLLEKE